MKKHISGLFKRRFTLIELLVVMAILVVLMGMGIGVFSYANRRMAESKTQALIKKLEVALNSYKEKHGYYLQYQNSYLYLDFDASDSPGVGLEEFLPDYQNMLNKDTITARDYISGDDVIYVMDAFAMPLLYRCPGGFNTTTFDICSMGADAEPGVSNDNDGTANPKDGNTSGTTVKDIPDAFLESKYGDDITNYGKAE